MFGEGDFKRAGKFKQWLGEKNYAAKEGATFLISGAEAQIAGMAGGKELIPQDSSEDPNFGYAFPYFTAEKQALVAEIRAQYEATGIHPVVADIGAGLGTMTWRLLAAGAQVDAFEYGVEAARQLQERMQRTPSVLLDDEPISDLLQVVSGDAIQNLSPADASDTTYTNKYDYVWLGNVVHFMTPDQVANLKQVLNIILKPGGQAFITSNALSSYQRMSDFPLLKEKVTQGKADGDYCPGFLAINAKNDHTALGAEGSVCLKQEDMEEGVLLKAEAYKPGLVGPTGVIEGTTDNFFHMIINILDPETLRKVFSPEFYVCAFLLNIKGEQEPDNTTSTTVSNVTILEKPSETLSEGAAAASEGTSEHAKPSCKFGKWSSFFNSSRTQLDALIQQEKNSKFKAALNDALESYNYGLLLRRASSRSRCSIVKILLDNMEAFKIDLHQESTTGKTALDWLRGSAEAHPMKEACIQLLEELMATHPTLSP
ncbi:MAG: class I SAM-dependent methyltransferase [Gammaproteobacteria bacterium]|nr:class I SAM-dependent methyltransferase [Gammaproteobacteria bacterium]